MPTRLALVLGLALTLLAPAAAQAATFTVDPADGTPCSEVDRTCPTIASAVSAAAAGDVITILKGTYAEAVSLGSGKDGLKLRGAGLGDVKITGAGTGDVISIGSQSVELSGVTVDVPGNGESAVAITASGAKVSASLLQRANPSTANVPVVDVSDSGSGELISTFVIQGAGSAGTPAIRSTGPGFSLADTVVASSTGPALVLEGGSNQILRSTLAATEAASDAVRVISNDAGNRALTTDSSGMLGGAKGAGIRATSTGTSAGDIALQVRHATITGSSNGIVLDASGATGTGILPGPARAAGNIDADVFSSIVHGQSQARRYQPGLPTSGTANSASLTFSNSDAPPPAEGNGSVDMGGATFTEDARLFQPRSLKLRPDAPVIDKGGPLQAGESTKDMEGGAREVDGPDADTAPQSDIGADEYVNAPPKAAFGITNRNPRQNETIGFVSSSSDPEQDLGGGIVEYRWDFGDGTKAVTKSGGVIHTYAQVGTYRTTLQVVDNQGAVSEVSAPQAVTVTDGIPPSVSIIKPVDGKRLNLKSTYRLGAKRPKPRQLAMLGKVADASGVKSVEVALYVVKRDKVKRRIARSSQTAPKRCEFYSGRLFAKKDCTKEIWLKVSVIPGGTWALSTKKGLRLPAGRYQMRVRATDNAGLMSVGFTKQDKTLVDFRVR